MRSFTLHAAFVKPWALPLSLCALLLSGIDAQRPTITLNAYDQNNAVTSCPAGLLEGTDSFVMTGSVDTTGVTITDYLSSLNVQTRLPSDAHFSDVLCTFTLSGCDRTPQVNECYCSGQNGNVYDFVINKTVDFVHSNIAIRVQWEANVLTDTAVSTPEDLPTFYQAAKVVYAGANDNQNTTISTSGQCTISQSSSITFCALNLQAPFTITFTQEGQTPLSSTSSCLTADVTEAAVSISYAESAGCERSQVISCAVALEATTPPDVTPTPTPAPSGIRLTSSTDVIQPNLTPDLSVTCTFQNPKDLDLTIISLEISKRESNTVVQEIAAVTLVHPLKVRELANVGASVSGKLDPQGLTFIRLDWSYPSENNTGVYLCDATSLDARGHTVKVKASLKVTSKSLDMQSLVNQFRAFTKQNQLTVDSLRHRVQAMENLEESVVRSLFDISPVTDGKQYLVSRSGTLSIYIAEALCHLTGGHLADIRSSAELHGIKTFVQSLARSSTARFSATYFSPTQENHPGRWVYRHNGEDMAYTGIWESGESDDKNRSCAALFHNNWKAEKRPCSSRYSDYNFICERSAVP